MTNLWAAIDLINEPRVRERGKLVVTLRKKEEGAWPRLTKGAPTPEPSADEDPLMRRAVEADARTLRKRRAMNGRWVRRPAPPPRQSIKCRGRGRLRALSSRSQ